MNILFPKHIARIAATIVMLGGAVGSSSADARAAKPTKRARISAMAAPAVEPRSHAMRYYGGPKSPMWPAVD
jgi:hypothetical protein